MAFLNPDTFNKTVKTILRFVKAAPNAVSEYEIVRLDLPLTKTALFYLKGNKYLVPSRGRRSYGKLFTNPAKAEVINASLEIQS